MTRTSSTATIAVAADYADAMMTARRAKNWLFFLLLIILVLQLAVFFLMRFNVLGADAGVTVTEPKDVDVGVATQTDASATQPAVEADTQPAAAETRPAVDVKVETTSGRRFGVADVLRYVIPVTNFMGIVLPVVLCVVLLLIVTIMLVGRLIGVSHVTSAFIWCVLLTILLFPWQALLIGSSRPPTDLPSPYLADAEQYEAVEFKLPGALYTWPELVRDIRFPNTDLVGFLKWFRYAGLPVVALLLLLMVQAKSSRGLKYALGESEVQVEVSSPVA